MIDNQYNNIYIINTRACAREKMLKRYLKFNLIRFVKI